MLRVRCDLLNCENNKSGSCTYAKIEGDLLLLCEKNGVSISKDLVDFDKYDLEIRIVNKNALKELKK